MTMNMFSSLKVERSPKVRYNLHATPLVWIIMQLNSQGNRYVSICANEFAAFFIIVVSRFSYHALHVIRFQTSQALRLRFVLNIHFIRFQNTYIHAQFSYKDILI